MEVYAGAAPATLALVVDVAADLELGLGLVARETLRAGRPGPMLVAATGDVTSGVGGVGGGAIGSSVEVATAAALLVVEAAVVVAVETAFVVVSTVETAFVVVVATVETAFVVVAAAVETTFVVVATVNATALATGAPANAAPHDCAGQNAAAIRTAAAIGPTNDLVLTFLMAPPGRCCS